MDVNVKFLFCEIFTESAVEKRLEERESEAEISDKEDRDIGPESGDDFVVETCVITTVESVTRIADDIHPQDTEDRVTIYSEMQFDSHVINSNDLGDGAQPQRSVSEALDVPVDSSEESTAT